MSLSSKFASKVLSAGNRFVKEVASKTTGQAKTQSGAAQSRPQQDTVFSKLSSRTNGAAARPQGSQSQQPRANLQSFRPANQQAGLAGQQQQRVQTPNYQHATAAAPSPRKQQPEPAGLKMFGDGRSNAPASQPGVHRTSMRPTGSSSSLSSMSSWGSTNSSSSLSSWSSTSSSGSSNPSSLSRPTSPSRPTTHASPAGPTSTAQAARPQQAASSASFGRTRPQSSEADTAQPKLQFIRGTRQVKAQYLEAKARMEAVTREHYQVDTALDNATDAMSDKEYDALNARYETLSAQKKTAVREHNALRNEMARMNIPVAQHVSQALAANLPMLEKLADLSGKFTKVDQTGMAFDLERTMRRSGAKMVSTFRTAQEFKELTGQRDAIIGSQAQLKQLLASDEMDGLRYADPKLHASLSQMAKMDLGQSFSKLDALQSVAKDIEEAFDGQGLSTMLYSIPSTPEEIRERKEQAARDHQEAFDQGYM
ncbi:hypothetical protein AVKW3434_22985 [Acidovorax sp. SUPP3434]|uniref:hypothetical protein n=1 Tax=Acidovorax sp. SUPP3434 TaxID=2920880 RepID=UPI0023DE3038|nr:hypothetical protein [Acidovorax sp. SUPP3434]GKT02308.1 hypothetical protein AVKW3434_22985 [Acidovorax sp. SUPP3434]